MNHQYHAENDNVRLRPLDENDIESLRIWRNDSSNSRFLSDIGTISSEQQKRWFESYLGNKDEIIFAVDMHLTTGNDREYELVGSLSFYNFQDDIAEFGKFLIGDKNAHGKHIGYNALMLALKTGFDELELHTICLHVYSENIAAMICYKHAGFRIVKSQIVSGQMEYYMELTDAEYKEGIKNEHY